MDYRARDYKIVTPVATEPVSLAQAKLHLNKTSNTFAGDMVTVQSILPGSHGVAAAYSLLGTAIDVLGKLTIVNLNAGTCGTGGSVAAKIQESDDNVSWQDFADGAFLTITEASDNAVQEIEYTGGKRYVRVACTVAVAACVFGADVITMTGDTTDDALIAIWIKAAREYCEGFTNRALATQTIEAYYNGFPSFLNHIELPKPPLQSVTSVKYKDYAGVETTLAVTTQYLVDTDSSFGRIVLPYGVAWPCFIPYPVNPVTIRFIAGYYASNLIPESIRQAMLLLIGHWSANREAVGSVTGEIAFAVRALLSMCEASRF